MFLEVSETFYFDCGWNAAVFTNLSGFETGWIFVNFENLNHFCQIQGWRNLPEEFKYELLAVLRKMV